MRKQLSKLVSMQFVAARRALPALGLLTLGLWAQLPAHAQVLEQPPATETEPAAPTAAVCPPTAQMPAPAKLRRMAQKGRDHGLLWRVDYQGRTAWLYGTLHVARLAWAFPGPTVVAALRSADSLALELNLLDPAQLQALQDGLRANPDAEPLPEALATRLAAQVQAACVPAATMQAMRPDAQVMTLLTLSGRMQGLDPAYGIDMSLAGAAKAMGKPVWALETPALQLRELISDDPTEIQDNVRSSLEQLESGEAAKATGTLAQAWADGRAQLLESYPQWCQCIHTEKERADYARLVDGRNPAMAQQIAAQLREGKAPFVAVGALHMVGPQGLPALLAAQGFAVQRVQPAADVPEPASRSSKNKASTQ